MQFLLEIFRTGEGFSSDVRDHMGREKRTRQLSGQTLEAAAEQGGKLGMLCGETSSASGGEILFLVVNCLIVRDWGLLLIGRLRLQKQTKDQTSADT